MKPIKDHHSLSAQHKLVNKVARSFFAAAFLVVATPVPAQAAEEQSPAWADAFAARIYKAWEAGEPMPQLSAAHPEATIADGYAVQKRFVARFAKKHNIGGFKAAAVGSAAQANLGIDGPLTGVMPRSGILRAEDEIVVDLADYPNRHLETEIGYTFNAPITEPLPDVDALREKIKHVFAVIEVPGGATEEKNPSTPADTVAWNGNAKALIVGAQKLDPANVNIDTIAITFTRDGETINTAKGGDAAGGQMQTLLKSVNDIVKRGYTIRPDHVLTNGALGKILPAEPGRYIADYGPL
ncbi:MAG: hypothetical protein U9Q79_00060, partial [Candidatus Hydrogenedentes bacterium]|nr:hypothetical protein [Candidatus Hydrogenedentota bacterium]